MLGNAMAVNFQHIYVLLAASGTLDLQQIPMYSHPFLVEEVLHVEVKREHIAWDMIPKRRLQMESIILGSAMAGKFQLIFVRLVTNGTSVDIMANNISSDERDLKIIILGNGIFWV